MEYAWRIQIMLKSGDCVEGLYFGPEPASHEVAHKLFNNKRDNDFVDCRGKDDASHLFVRAGDISAFEIFVKEKDSKK